VSNYALFSKAFSQTATRSIDSESGVIKGVAVITEGPALGHTDFGTGLPIFADATTLEEVLACASQFEGGLKVKMTHGGDAADIVGVLRNFRIDGTVLRADFYSLKTTPHRAYIFEIAETVPHAFGLSIAFSGKHDVIGEQAMARCSEIYSADLVSEPAANPNGLFTAQPNRDGPKLTIENTSKMEDDMKDVLAKLSAQIEEMGARLSKLETPVVPEVDAEVEVPDAELAEHVNPEAMSAQLAKAAESGAMAALKLFTAQFGTPAIPATSHQASNPAGSTAKKFEDLVAAKATELGSKTEAIRFCVKNHASEHSAYESRVRSGEVITL
jgi:hypothetical protein